MEMRIDLLIAIFVAGFLATDIWRYGGGLFGTRLTEGSLIYRWVKMVATALVAALVIKLTLYASGSLGETSLFSRISGLAIATLVFFGLRKQNYNLALGLSVIVGIFILFAVDATIT